MILEYILLCGLVFFNLRNVLDIFVSIYSLLNLLWCGFLFIDLAVSWVWGCLPPTLGHFCLLFLWITLDSYSSCSRLPNRHLRCPWDFLTIIPGSRPHFQIFISMYLSSILCNFFVEWSYLLIFSSVSVNQ